MAAPACVYMQRTYVHIGVRFALYRDIEICVKACMVYMCYAPRSKLLFYQVKYLNVITYFCKAFCVIR